MSSTATRPLQRSASFHVTRREEPTDDPADASEKKVVWQSEPGSKIKRTIYSDGSTIVVDKNGMIYETDSTGIYKTWYGPFQLAHVGVDKRATLK